MSKDNKADQVGIGEEIEVAISKTEAFIEKNQKQLIYAVLAVVVIVSGFLLFNRYYLAPQEVEAQDQMAKGEQYFAVDSFNIALNGDGVDFIGFTNVIENYGMTKSADLANAYAGISSFKLGDYQKAIDYLSAFDGDGDVNVSPVMTGLIGDAYVELKDLDKALSFYEKAYSSENIVFSPVFMKKAALVYESKGEFQSAFDLYTKIKTTYPKSTEAQDVDKYIERARLSK